MTESGHRLWGIITVAQLVAWSSIAQTNLLTPSVQLAVSNILSRLTNDEAKAAFKARLEKEFPKPVLLPLNAFSGYSTNGPIVYGGTRSGHTNSTINPVYLELHRLGYPIPISGVSYFTNKTFHHFVAGSLNNLLWTNLIAHTNGHTTQIWSTRSHPSGWPSVPPLATWNTNCLMWGMKGLTALSPCWQGELLPGQIPITALTPRHGYSRGHDMAPDGFHTLWVGARVWFLTLDNKIVERTVAREVVRTSALSGRDYTLFLFNEDLPSSIVPIRVTAEKTRFSKCPVVPGTPWLGYFTEQSGNVSAEVPGFQVATMKGGDSGSPNMLPMPGELVFYSGRTTSGPSPEMQTDMDELCRLNRLDPAKYQMQWANLSAFESY